MRYLGNYLQIVNEGDFIISEAADGTITYSETNGRILNAPYD